MDKSMEEVILKLKALDGEVTSQIIKDLIKAHEPERERLKGLYDRYKGEVPILERTLPNPNKLNNKLANDFRGNLTRIHTGYLFGKPITYELEKANYNETKYKKNEELISDFNKRNSITNIDAETGKMANICGYTPRLYYISGKDNPEKGKEKVMLLKPWEVIFVYDRSVDELQYALRYYDYYIMDGEKPKKTIRVEWYDDTDITYYVRNTEGNYVLDDTEPVNPQPHMFQYVPIVKFKRNAEEQGVFEKVESLIDAVDRSMSDSQNEIEEFRLAYMLFFGSEPTKEVIDKARQTGAFGLDDNDRVEFLTKDMNGDFINKHLDRAIEHIYKFSNTVDMRDEKFSGGEQSGESRKWKMAPMEYESATHERNFIQATRDQYKVLSSAWNTKGYDINYLDIKPTLTRNHPVDLQYMATVAGALKGLVSDRTILALLPFIDNVEEEIERIKEERENRVDLDNLGDNNEPKE